MFGDKFLGRCSRAGADLEPDINASVNGVSMSGLKHVWGGAAQVLSSMRSAFGGWWQSTLTKEELPEDELDLEARFERLAESIASEEFTVGELEAFLYALHQDYGPEEGSATFWFELLDQLVPAMAGLPEAERDQGMRAVGCMRDLIVLRLHTDRAYALACFHADLLLLRHANKNNLNTIADRICGYIRVLPEKVLLFGLREMSKAFRFADSQGDLQEQLLIFRKLEAIKDIDARCTQWNKKRRVGLQSAASEARQLRYWRQACNRLGHFDVRVAGQAQWEVAQCFEQLDPEALLYDLNKVLAAEAAVQKLAVSPQQTASSEPQGFHAGAAINHQPVLLAAAARRITIGVLANFDKHTQALQRLKHELSLTVIVSRTDTAGVCGVDDVATLKQLYDQIGLDEVSPYIWVSQLNSLLTSSLDAASRDQISALRAEIIAEVQHNPYAVARDLLGGLGLVAYSDSTAWSKAQAHLDFYTQHMPPRFMALHLQALYKQASSLPVITDGVDDGCLLEVVATLRESWKSAVIAYVSSTFAGLASGEWAAFLSAEHGLVSVVGLLEELENDEAVEWVYGYLQREVGEDVVVDLRARVETVCKQRSEDERALAEEAQQHEAQQLVIRKNAVAEFNSWSSYLQRTGRSTVVGVTAWGVGKVAGVIARTCCWVQQNPGASVLFAMAGGLAYRMPSAAAASVRGSVSHANTSIAFGPRLLAAAVQSPLADLAGNGLVETSITVPVSTFTPNHVAVEVTLDPDGALPAWVEWRPEKQPFGVSDGRGFYGPFVRTTVESLATGMHSIVDLGDNKVLAGSFRNAGLVLIDTSDPSALTVLDTYVLPRDNLGALDLEAAKLLVADDGTIIVAGSRGGIYRVRINGDSIEPVSRYNIDGNNVFEIDLAGASLFAAGYNGGHELRYLRLESDGSISYVSSFHKYSVVACAFYEGDTLIVASRFGNAIYAVNTTLFGGPDAPVSAIAQIPIMASFGAVVRPTKVVASAENDIIAVLDETSLVMLSLNKARSAFTERGRSAISNGGRLILVDRRLFLCHQYHLAVVDVSDPSNPRFIAHYQEGQQSACADLTQRGQDIFIATGTTQGEVRWVTSRMYSIGELTVLPQLDARGNEVELRLTATAPDSSTTAELVTASMANLPTLLLDGAVPATQSFIAQPFTWHLNYTNIHDPEGDRIEGTLEAGYPAWVSVREPRPPELSTYVTSANPSGPAGQYYNFSPIGPDLFVAASTEWFALVRRVDESTLERMYIQDVAGSISRQRQSVSSNLNGQLFVVTNPLSSAQDRVEVWDVSDPAGAVLQTSFSFEAGSVGQSATWVENQGLLYVTQKTPAKMHVFEVSSSDGSLTPKQVFEWLDTSRDFWDLVPGPDGLGYLSVFNVGVLALDLSQGPPQVIAVWSDPVVQIQAVTFSFEDYMMYAASGDAVYVVDVSYVRTQGFLLRSSYSASLSFDVAVFGNLLLRTNRAGGMEVMVRGGERGWRLSSHQQYTVANPEGTGFIGAYDVWPIDSSHVLLAAGRPGVEQVTWPDGPDTAAVYEGNAPELTHGSHSIPVAVEDVGAGATAEVTPVTWSHEVLNRDPSWDAAVLEGKVLEGPAGAGAFWELRVPVAAVIDFDVGDTERLVFRYERPSWMDARVEVEVSPEGGSEAFIVLSGIPPARSPTEVTVKIFADDPVYQAHGDPGGGSAPAGAGRGELAFVFRRVNEPTVINPPDASALEFRILTQAEYDRRVDAGESLEQCKVINAVINPDNDALAMTLSDTGEARNSSAIALRSELSASLQRLCVSLKPGSETQGAYALRLCVDDDRSITCGDMLLTVLDRLLLANQAPSYNLGVGQDFLAFLLSPFFDADADAIAIEIVRSPEWLAVDASDAINITLSGAATAAAVSASVRENQLELRGVTEGSTASLVIDFTASNTLRVAFPAQADLDEDSSTALFEDGVFELDTAGEMLTVRLRVSDTSAANLLPDTEGGTEANYNAATGVWAASGPVTEVRDLVQRVRLALQLNFFGLASVEASVSDELGQVAERSTEVTVANVPDDLRMNPDRLMTAVTVNVGDAERVVTVPRDVVIDVDGGSIQGITAEANGEPVTAAGFNGLFRTEVDPATGQLTLFVHAQVGKGHHGKTYTLGYVHVGSQNTVTVLQLLTIPNDQSIFDETNIDVARRNATKRVGQRMVLTLGGFSDRQGDIPRVSLWSDRLGTQLLPEMFQVNVTFDAGGMPKLVMTIPEIPLALVGSHNLYAHLTDGIASQPAVELIEASVSRSLEVGPVGATVEAIEDSSFILGDQPQSLEIETPAGRLSVTATLSNSAAVSVATDSEGDAHAIYNAADGQWAIAEASKQNVMALLERMRFVLAQDYNGLFSASFDIRDSLGQSTRLELQVRVQGTPDTLSIAESLPSQEVPVGQRRSYTLRSSAVSNPDSLAVVYRVFVDGVRLGPGGLPPFQFDVTATGEVAVTMTPEPGSGHHGHDYTVTYEVVNSMDDTDAVELTQAWSAPNERPIVDSSATAFRPVTLRVGEIGWQRCIRVGTPADPQDVYDPQEDAITMQAASDAAQSEPLFPGLLFNATSRCFLLPLVLNTLESQQTRVVHLAFSDGIAPGFTTASFGVTIVKSLAVEITSGAESYAVNEDSGSVVTTGLTITSDASDTVVVSITIEPLNGGDVSLRSDPSVRSDNAGSIALSGASSDLNDQLSSGLVVAPAIDFAGRIRLLVVVNDGVNHDQTAAYTVNVAQVNDPPRFTEPHETLALTTNVWPMGYIFPTYGCVQILRESATDAENPTSALRLFINASSTTVQSPDWWPSGISVLPLPIGFEANLTSSEAQVCGASATSLQSTYSVCVMDSDRAVTCSEASIEVREWWRTAWDSLGFTGQLGLGFAIGFPILMSLLLYLANTRRRAMTWNRIEELNDVLYFLRAVIAPKKWGLTAMRSQKTLFKETMLDISQAADERQADLLLNSIEKIFVDVFVYEMTHVVQHRQESVTKRDRYGNKPTWLRPVLRKLHEFLDRGKWPNTVVTNQSNINTSGSPEDILERLLTLTRSVLVVANQRGTCEFSCRCPGSRRMLPHRKTGPIDVKMSAVIARSLDLFAMLYHVMECSFGKNPGVFDDEKRARFITSLRDMRRISQVRTKAQRQVRFHIEATLAAMLRTHDDSTMLLLLLKGFNAVGTCYRTVRNAPSDDWYSYHVLFTLGGLLLKHAPGELNNGGAEDLIRHMQWQMHSWVYGRWCIRAPSWLKMFSFVLAMDTVASHGPSDAVMRDAFSGAKVSIKGRANAPDANTSRFTRYIFPVYSRFQRLLDHLSCTKRSGVIGLPGLLAVKDLQWTSSSACRNIIAVFRCSRERDGLIVAFGSAMTTTVWVLTLGWKDRYHAWPASYAKGVIAPKGAVGSNARPLLVCDDVGCVASPSPSQSFAHTQSNPLHDNPQLMIQFRSTRALDGRSGKDSPTGAQRRRMRRQSRSVAAAERKVATCQNPLLSVGRVNEEADVSKRQSELRLPGADTGSRLKVVSSLARAGSWRGGQKGRRGSRPTQARNKLLSMLTSVQGTDDVPAPVQSLAIPPVASPPSEPKPTPPLSPPDEFLDMTSSDSDSEDDKAAGVGADLQ